PVFALFAVHALRPPSEPSPWRKDRITNRWLALASAERICEPDRFTSIGTDRHQAERYTRHLRDRLNVGACRRGKVCDRARGTRELVPTIEAHIDGLGAYEVLGVRRRL